MQRIQNIRTGHEGKANHDRPPSAPVIPTQGPPDRFTRAGEDLARPMIAEGFARDRAATAIYQQIVRDSIEVTNSGVVTFAVFDPATELVQVVAWAIRPLSRAQRTLEAIWRFLPGWDPVLVRQHARANLSNETVYFAGRSVSATLRQVAEGAVDPRIVLVGEMIMGLEHAFLCPLKVGRQVVGSLGFYSKAPLTDHERRVCDAFVQEASLTVENFQLREQIKLQAGGLREATRYGVAELPTSRVPNSPSLQLLTKRELEVLALVAQGLHNREIAERLVVSPATVKAHVEHVIAKLGVSDRTEAAVKAVTGGFVEAPRRS